MATGAMMMTGLKATSTGEDNGLVFDSFLRQGMSERHFDSVLDDADDADDVA